MILFAALGFVVLSLWQAWQNDYAPTSVPVNFEQAAIAGNTANGAAINNSNINQDIPTPVVMNDDLPVSVDTSPAADSSKLQSVQRIVIETDVFNAVIDTHGGDLRGSALKQYPVESNKPDVPIVLFSDLNGKFYASQGGFLSKQPSANHHSVYKTAASEYRLADGQDSMEVVLSWAEQGIEIEKVFTFRRGEYLVDVNYRIKNNSTEPWNGRMYEQLQQRHLPESRKMLPTFTGAAISNADKRYEKIKFDDLVEEPINQETDSGWVAMIQHYFVSAIIPESGKVHNYYSKVINTNSYVVGLFGPQISVAPGETHEAKVKVYSGPKLQATLEKIAPGLELTVDYGILWFIAKPIFWLLGLIHTLVGNWGWAIILVTVVIKGIFYPLSAMGYKSMARMRKVTPRLTAIRERYSSDKARMNQAMMDFYKEEKINPLGGCFPILVQIPVFLSLYWVLLESVEMRQAPFMLWIQDLSIKDPIFILPLIMGVSMFVQQKLNPAPPDPIQAKVMQFLPIVFTAFFAFFPAGLVLYWVTNNILSIFQQWTITKRIDAEK